MERVPEQIFNKAKLELEAKVERASDRLGAEISVGAPEGVVIPELKLTPNKPNFARAQVPVCIAGEFATNMWVIAFRPGDGTGDDSGFSEGSLGVPEDIAKRSPRSLTVFYPRPKNGMDFEICIPLVKAGFGNYYGGTSLDLLSIEEREEGPSVTVVDNNPGLRSISSGKYPDSFITLGTDSFGRRVGDPHALVYPVQGSGDNYLSTHLDIVTFMPAMTSDDPKVTDLLAAFDPANPYTK